MADRHLLIDGMNVMGATPDGWWRDRDAAAARLVERLKRLAVVGEAVTVVFDGKAPDDLPEGDHDGVSVLFARRAGPDAADDRIVELAQARPEDYCVITSDGYLRERLTGFGVEVQGVSALLRRLDQGEAGTGQG